MKLKTIRANLVRRLCVNYVAYLGQPYRSSQWTQGYLQAKNDCENFLKQCEIYEPSENEEDVAESA
jgi:hypothetical protein